MGTVSQRAGGGLHYAWIIVGAVAVIALAASGVRSSFGVFIKPIESDFGWDRTALSIVASIGFIFNGAVGPIMGRAADRWGPRGVLGISAVLLGVGTLGAGIAVSLWQLYLTVGVLMAIGAGGIATSVTATVAGRWFDRHRGLVIGIFGGAVAAGQLLIVPMAMWLTVTWTWRTALLILGAAFLVGIVPLILTLVRNDPKDVGLEPFGSTAWKT